MPALTVRHGDEAVTAGVQTRDALDGPVRNFHAHERRPGIGAHDVRDLEHGRADVR